VGKYLKAEVVGGGFGVDLPQAMIASEVCKWSIVMKKRKNRKWGGGTVVLRVWRRDCLSSCKLSSYCRMPILAKG